MEDFCSFRKALENLNNCGYCSAPMLPRLTLSHDDHQVSAYIPEEAFGSRLRCVQAAEHRLYEYYVEAAQQFALYSAPLSAEGILMQFGQHFASRLNELRAQLEADGTGLLQQYKAAFDAQMAREIERLVIRPALRALEAVICENT